MVVIHGELPEQKLTLQIILFYHFIHLAPNPRQPYYVSSDGVVLGGGQN